MSKNTPATDSTTTTSASSEYTSSTTSASGTTTDHSSSTTSSSYSSSSTSSSVSSEGGYSNDSGSATEYSAPTSVSRDVDFDGTVDVIHSTTAAGERTITHVNDAGEVTLIEKDSDGNGTFDTVATQASDGTILVGQDVDDDGDIDLVGHYEDGALQRLDTLENGQVVESLFDTDGDGAPDTMTADLDRDGAVDTLGVDTDGDGFIDTVAADRDGDGATDLLAVDTDADGVVDFEVTGEQLEAGADSVAADSAGHGYPGDDAAF